MKEQLQKMIDLIKSGRYDQEDAHGKYDSLLEKYILNINDYGQDEYLLMCELISLDKDFWYA